MASLQGRHALVTGGGRGIGRAIAAALTEAGAAVTITGRNEKALADVVGQGEAAGYVIADVTDAKAVDSSIKQAVKARGPVDPETGWLFDFARLDEAWEPLHARFDHRNLNDVPGLENATSENLAIYIWNAIRPQIPQLSAVTVWETTDGKCTYRGA